MKSILSSKHLIALVLALVVLVGSTVGGTMAWFTTDRGGEQDEAATGELDVEVYWKKMAQKYVEIYKHNGGNPDTPYDDDYRLSSIDWEPGYTAVRHIKIVNEGIYAADCKLTFLPTPENGEAVGKWDRNELDNCLADVITVYVRAGEAHLTRDSNGVKLKDWMDPDNEEMKTKYGPLFSFPLSSCGFGDEETSLTVSLDTEAQQDEQYHLPYERVFTVVLQMDPSAGNEYQNLSTGPFSLVLKATQRASEADDIDRAYDKNAVKADFFA